MIKIEILKTVGEYKAGQTVTVPTDDNGVPVSRFWRRRIKDDDGFCKVLDKSAAIPKKYRSKESNEESL